jgi:hypothetical protein
MNSKDQFALNSENWRMIFTAAVMDVACVSWELPHSSVHILTLMDFPALAALIRFMNASSSEEGEQDASGQPLPAFLLAAGRGFDGRFLACIVLGL